MASILPDRTRFVLPNFRNSGTAAALGELSRTTTTTLPDLPRPDFRVRAADWQNKPTIALAGDIVSAALVSNDTHPPVVREAAEFAVVQSVEAPPVLVSAARRILGHRERDSKSPESDLTLHGLLRAERQQELRWKVGHLKSTILEFGHNPIAFSDLARLYLLLGHKERARKYMTIAVSLAPTSRYVLRSAARLHVHCGDPERAFDLLHRNARTYRDPWLASAALATAGLIEKEKLAIRPAMRLLKNSDFLPFSLTELRAGVGSVELLQGNRRSSKRLFREALTDPNDNSLAQIEWALSQETLFDLDLAAYGVARRYEALAIEAFARQQWDSLLLYCASWLSDLPYLSRPALMGAHVASVVLEDYQTAQAFCEAARMVSGDDPQLVNMHAYALALDNKTDAAIETLDAVPLARVDDIATATCLRATRGLAHFRAGRVAEGRTMYVAAIEETEGLSDPIWAQIAVLNYAREEFVATGCVPETLLESVRKLKIPRQAKTTQVLKDKVLKLLMRRGV